MRLTTAVFQEIALILSAHTGATVRRVLLEMILSARMLTNAQMNHSTATRMLLVKTLLVLLTVIAIMDTMATGLTAQTKTNALCRLKGVIQMQTASTLPDLLTAPVKPDLQEMVPAVRILTSAL